MHFSNEKSINWRKILQQAKLEKQKKFDDLMKSISVQYEKQKKTKISCISSDDYEINYYKITKQVPKMLTLKQIENKLIIQLNFDFKNRQKLLEKMNSKEI